MNKKMAADASPSASEVTELLTFFQSTSTKNDDEQRVAAKSVAAQRKEVAEAERAFRKVSEESRTKGREASILFNASDATKELKMVITYNVARASWRPTYDIRVTASHEIHAAHVLRQREAEQWRGLGRRAALSLHGYPVRWRLPRGAALEDGELWKAGAEPQRIPTEIHDERGAENGANGGPGKDGGRSERR